MTDAPRGPTTEELRARVLAQLEADARPLEYDPARPPRPIEGRTFYDPASTPPLDKEKGERLGSPLR